MFQIKELDQTIKNRITGKSFPGNIDEAQITYDDLRYLLIDHYDFHGNVIQGEMICHKSIADTVICIFRELLAVKYPIEKMRLIDDYDASDERSMADNNSSAFNYRVISGTDVLSNHGKGLAIDINPLYNPYLPENPNAAPIQPANATPYVDRTRDFPCKLTDEDICVRTFKEYGFAWGGNWTTSVDYQHFEYIAE